MRYIPERRGALFAVTVSGDECEPWIKRGGTAYIRAGGVPRDGDVGLFNDGQELVIRQYCEDWAGNACLLCLNRRRSDGDIIVPAGGRPLVCFGLVELDAPVPLPEK